MLRSCSSGDDVIDMSISIVSLSSACGAPCGCASGLSASSTRRVVCAAHPTVFRFAGQRRQQQVAHLLHQARIAPEYMKCLIEQQPVFRPLHDAARQGVVELVAVADVDQARGLHTIENRRRTDGTPARRRTRTNSVMLSASFRPRTGRRARGSGKLTTFEPAPVIRPCIQPFPPEPRSGSAPPRCR